MEESVSTIELKGTVVFLPFAISSKSESLRPFIYVNRNEVIKIMKAGDNPFENGALKSFDGHSILAKGHYGKARTFLIEKITDLKNEGIIEEDNTKETEEK